MTTDLTSPNEPALSAMTFADARKLILATIVDVRKGAIPAAQAGAILAGMKMLHDSVQVEINIAKLAIQTEGKANEFGKAVKMGQRLLIG